VRLPTDAMNIIELNNLAYSWPGSSQACLEIEQFLLKRGEKLFISGASGSGKSTLLGLLAGILTPSAGSLSILQTPFGDLTSSARDKFRADHIGYIFQQFNLIPYLSVIENVLLPCHFSKQRHAQIKPDPYTQASNLLQQLRLPKSCLNKPVTQLSIGQQQRVAAARALIGNPELVIADEPTSALDSQSRNAFIQLLMEQCERTGASLLFVSHDEQLQSHFDRHLALSTLNNVVQNPDEYL